MLCNTCEEVFTRTYWQWKASKQWKGSDRPPLFFSGHHTTLESLRNSALRFCFVCYRVLQSTKRQFPHLQQQTAVPHSFLTVACAWPDLNYVTINLSSELEEQFATERPGRKTNLRLEQFTICPDLGCATPFTSKVIASTTDIITCASTVQRWIDECTRVHPKCNGLRSHNWSPTRLLDVSDPNRILLVKTMSQFADSPYMTLSHSWGSSAITKLTHKRLESFEHGISVIDLPQTFIDAVAVVRALNIRYLWIDSLCIIQDSISDWEQEASTMSKVYQNSVCNIGAAVATDGRGGLFCSRNADLVDTPRFTHNNQNYRIKWMNLDITGAPLYRRGWVVQERWLCPRMLHFGAEQIFWECRIASASESVPDFTPYSEDLISGKTGEGRALHETAPGAELIGVLASSMGVPWNALIRIYSETDLTFKTDKMVAFSGLARAFNQYDPTDEYLAGMWKHNFVAQMLWHSFETQRYSTYIAPTWSWASTDGVVKPFPYYSHERSFTRQVSVMLGYHLEFQNSYQNVHLKDGWVLIRGPIKEVMISPAPEDPLRSISMPTAWCLLRDDESSPGQQEVWLDYAPNTDAIWAEHFYFLSLVLSPKRDANDSDSQGIHGVLLRREPYKQQCFSRVGYAFVGDSEWVSKAVTPTKISALSDLPFDIEKGYTVRLI